MITKAWADDVTPGEKIMIDDGKIQLEVVKVEDRVIFAKVLTDGLLKQRKGIKYPWFTRKLRCTNCKRFNFR